jgi:hypothetical protein
MIIFIPLPLIALFLAYKHKVGWKLVLTTFISCLVFAFVATFILELLNGPHPECGINDSVGPCDLAGRTIWLYPFSAILTTIFIWPVALGISIRTKKIMIRNYKKVLLVIATLSVVSLLFVLVGSNSKNTVITDVVCDLSVKYEDCPEGSQVDYLPPSTCLAITRECMGVKCKGELIKSKCYKITIDSTKLKIKNFRTPLPGYLGICDSLAPQCGYCTGQIIGDACYVSQNELSEYKKTYPSVETQ